MKSTSNIASGLVAALIFGVSLGFFDVALSLGPHPPRLESLLFATLSVLTTALLVTACYAALWLVLSVAARDWVAGRTASITVFVAVLVVLFLMFPLQPAPKNMLRFVAVFGIALLAATGAGRLSRYVEGSPRRESLGGLALSIPALCMWSFLFMWVQVYRVGASKSLGSLLSLVAYGAFVVITAAWFWRLGGRGGRRVVFMLSILLVAAGFGGGLSERATPGTRAGYHEGHAIPRVILITIDALRRTALSCYGDEVETPNIDRLAADAVVFDNALSAAPWTLPSLSSIMTGLPPSAHTAILHTSTLPESLTTLAEYMRDAGYHTGAIGDNPYLDPGRNLSQGFVEYNAFPKQKPSRSIAAAVLTRLMRHGYLSEATTDDLTELSIEWIRRNRDRDFFFWLHYFDPHGPWEPPPAFQPSMKPPPGMSYRFQGIKEVRAGMSAAQPEQRDWLKYLYDGEVRYVDAAVGRLLDALEREGIYDDALIILTSDHGEEFFEHGNLGHGQSLYNELLGVPLMIKLPGFASGRRVDETVPTQAILPTILDLCGLDPPREDFVASLQPLLEPGDNAYSAAPIFSMAVAFYEDREAVTFNDMKYSRRLHSLREELYDLGRDAPEQDNIAPSQPAKVDTARALLDAQSDRSSELRARYNLLSVEGLKLDPETIRRLKALGYL